MDATGLSGASKPPTRDPSKSLIGTLFARRLWICAAEVPCLLANREMVPAKLKMQLSPPMEPGDYGPVLSFSATDRSIQN